jgi:hypothetical protein
LLVTTLQRTLRLLALSAVATVVALGALVAVPTTSTAAAPEVQDRAARNYFGAIAISIDQAWAVRYDYRTKRGARQAALRKCRTVSDYPGRCVVSVWVRNGCAATAVKVNADGFVTRYASAYARTKRRARILALNRLSRPRKILAWVCTTR